MKLAPLTPEAELARLLRPAGGGLYLVSTGLAEQQALQKCLYDASTEQAVQSAFIAQISTIAEARVCILGVPSDVGAGFRRGANLGPQELRLALLRAFPDFRERMAAHHVIDLGDVFVVPQLLHDSMLSEAQLRASRRAIYGDSAATANFPVSPLSIEERALDLILAINPRIIPIVLGGDHSTAWPVAAALAKRGKNFAIVQPDAHTDLLAERLGVRYCFATWSYHANEAIGRGQKLIQVGIRASRFDKAHWESTLDVKQFWAEECTRHPGAAIDAIVAHAKSLSVEGIYFSNDIDGTDASFASATGTPEVAGPDPEFYLELIRRLGREVGLIAGDIMEVAPPLGPTPEAARYTVDLGARYLTETLSAALKTNFAA